MGWDNRILNVNGRGVRMLEAAISLACDDGYSDLKNSTAKRIIGCLVSPEHGLIWLWSACDNCARYPAPLTPRQAAEISLEWLASEEAKQIPFKDWDANADHDGDNSLGWRVYCEDWGHVGPATWHAICAVRPAYLWHGK